MHSTLKGGLRLQQAPIPSGIALNINSLPAAPSEQMVCITQMFSVPSAKFNEPPGSNVQPPADFFDYAILTVLAIPVVTIFFKLLKHVHSIIQAELKMENESPALRLFLLSH
jgi:hypothetical protein